MQSRDNHLDRSTAPGFRVLAQPSRSPTPLQQSRPDTVLPPIFLSRCVTKSTHVPFARRSLDGLDHSIPIERLAEGLLQIAVSRTPRPEHSLSPSKFTAPGRSRYSAKDFATGIRDAHLQNRIYGPFKVRLSASDITMTRKSS